MVRELHGYPIQRFFGFWDTLFKSSLPMFNYTHAFNIRTILAEKDRIPKEMIDKHVLDLWN